MYTLRDKVKVSPVTTSDSTQRWPVPRNSGRQHVLHSRFRRFPVLDSLIGLSNCLISLTIDATLFTKFELVNDVFNLCRITNPMLITFIIKRASRTSGLKPIAQD